MKIVRRSLIFHQYSSTPAFSWLNPTHLFQAIHIPKIHWASPQVLQLRPVELPALKPNQVRVKASHGGLAVGNFGTCFGHMFCRQKVESLWRFDDQNGFMLGEPVGISRTNIYNIINQSTLHLLVSPLLSVIVIRASYTDLASFEMVSSAVIASCLYFIEGLHAGDEPTQTIFNH